MEAYTEMSGKPAMQCLLYRPNVHRQGPRNEHDPTILAFRDNTDPSSLSAAGQSPKS